MEYQSFSRGARSRDGKVGAVFGIILGILVLAIFATPMPTGTPQQQLASYSLRSWEWQAATSVFAILFAILFAVYLRTALAGKSYGLATAGAVLFILGTVIVSAFTLVEAGAMNTLAGIYADPTSTAADRNSAVLVANVILNNPVGFLGFILFVPAGIVLFSLAMLNSKTFPNWLADGGMALEVVVLIAVAISAFVSLTGTAGSVVFIAFSILLLVWIFGSAGFLWRSARMAAVGEPAPA